MERTSSELDLEEVSESEGTMPSFKMLVALSWIGIPDEISQRAVEGSLPPSSAVASSPVSLDHVNLLDIL